MCLEKYTKTKLCVHSRPIKTQFSIATAKTGIDYRKYCKGEITKDEFTKRAKYTWIGQAGAVVGSSGGMIGGFVLG